MRVAPSDRNGSARPRAHDTRGHIAPSRPLSGSRLQLIGHLIVSAITSEGQFPTVIRHVCFVLHQVTYTPWVETRSVPHPATNQCRVVPRDMCPSLFGT